MKKFTAKKVALAMFLAGYAASGAFALTTSTTASVKGSVPVITQPGTATAGFSYEIQRGGIDISTLPAAEQNAREGDVIVIKFDYDDVDGDEADDFTAPLTSNTQAKFELYTYDTSAASENNVASPTTTTAVTMSVTGEYSWTIPASSAGQQIGIRLTAVSAYGDPRYNYPHDFSGNDIFAVTGGSGTTPPGVIIVPSVSSLGYRIILSGTLTDIYATNITGETAGTNSLALGSTYEVVLYTDTTAATTTPTSGYSLQWHAISVNAAANGVAAGTNVTLDNATNATITLPTTNAGAITAWPA